MGMLVRFGPITPQIPLPSNTNEQKIVIEKQNQSQIYCTNFAHPATHPLYTLGPP